MVCWRMENFAAELAAAGSAVGTWSLVGLVRAAWPELWSDMLRKRVPKMLFVAAVAAALGGVVASGVGLPAAAAMKVCAVAYSAAVTLRQITKPGSVGDERFRGYFDRAPPD